MDPVSQGLAGALFAQIGARRVGAEAGRPCRVRAATVIGAMAGMAPDLDVLISSGSDPLVGLTYHRHFTHALMFAPVGALVVALIVWLVWRKLTFGTIWWFAFLGWLSHGMLDVLTSYGTLWWWPLSGRRLSLDWIAIIDPAVTVPALLLAAAAWFLRRPTWSVVAVAWALIYFAAGAVQNHRGLEAQQAIAQSRGQVIERGRVMPSIANLLVWRSVYRSGDTIYTDGIRLGIRGPVKVYPGGAVPVFSGGTPLQAEAPGPVSASAARDVERFAHFADRYVGLLDRVGDMVTLGDMRYGIPVQSVQPLWGIGIDLSDTRPTVMHSYGGRPRQELQEELWRKIRGQPCEQPDCYTLAP
jgi:inner membrane protein